MRRFSAYGFSDGETRDFGANQKIHLISRAGWHALVCFFGWVARQDFGWRLASEAMGSIQYQDTLDVLLQKLREPTHGTLNSSVLEAAYVSIGAFVGPRLTTIWSNCMDESGI